MLFIIRMYYSVSEIPRIIIITFKCVISYIFLVEIVQNIIFCINGHYAFNIIENIYDLRFISIMCRKMCSGLVFNGPDLP